LVQTTVVIKRHCLNITIKII